MSGRRRGPHQRREGEQDFELNIASVIDCFTVLITYLLVSASFISISALDIDVTGVGDAPHTEPPPVSIAVELDMKHVLHVKLTGKEKDEWVVEAKDGTWDLDSLGAKLEAIKEKWPVVEAAFVAADDDLEYREVVKVVETTKRTHKNVTLGDRT